MKNLLSILLSFLSLTATAQVSQPAMFSLQGYGGNSNDVILSHVTATNDGFIVHLSTASNAGTGNLDSFCNLGGFRYVYLKYSADGTFQWHKCFAPGIIFPMSNGDFMYGISSYNISGGRVMAFGREDSNGNVLWQKNFGNNASPILDDMMATNDGGYIMAGTTIYADTDFIVHYGSWMFEDIAVIKVDSNGNKIWSRVLGGTGEEEVCSVIPAPHSGCYIYGMTASNDNDCVGNHGGYDAYLVRLDSMGNTIWHRDFGGSSNEGNDFLGTPGWGVSNGKGGVILATATKSNDGNVQHFISGSISDYWSMEVDSSGNMIWDNCYGGIGGGDLDAYTVCKAADGSIWMNGNSFGQGGEIDTTYDETPNGDSWIVHADSVGNFLSAKVLGGLQYNTGLMIYPLSNNFVMAGGGYSDNNGSFSSLEWYGDIDAYLAVFAPWTTNVNSVISGNNAIKIYPNPANDKLHIQTVAGNRFAISDITGRQLYTANIQSNRSAEVDVSNWPRGMYFVQVTDQNNISTTKKLLIQ